MRYFSIILLINCLFHFSAEGKTKVLSLETIPDIHWSKDPISVLKPDAESADLKSIASFSENNWQSLSAIDVKDLKRETWCKFSLHNPTNDVLSISYSYSFMVDTVEVFVQTPNGLKPIGRTGFHFPRSSKEVNSWMSYFLLKVLPQDTVRLYVRIVEENEAEREGILYPQLENSHYVRQADAEEIAFQFAFLGSILVFVILACIAFFTFRERDFLYYAALTFSFTLNSFLFSFVHHFFLEPGSTWETFLMHIPFLSFVVIFLYLFIANRLDLNRNANRLNRFYKWTSLAGSIFFLPLYYSENLAFGILLAAGTSVVLLVFALTVIILERRKGNSEANSLLYSMSILILSGIATSIIWIVAPNQEKFEHIGHFGLFAFAAYLLYSLYSRISQIKLSRLKAQIEKEKSDEILFNVLPEEIALELKNTGKSEAKQIENVSVLFTDFKGFTKLSEKLSPVQMIDELQNCFEAFDRIVEKYGIEKIKTIGDSYMTAGGLPVQSPDSVKKTVLAGLEMQDFISERKKQMDAKGEPAFEMRAGIHTGTVLAGVVGIRKFQYDIWGDTVNTSSRMESSGAVGRVNISKETYEQLKDDPEFIFESRGKVEAKGKGEIEMYFVSKK